MSIYKDLVNLNYIFNNNLNFSHSGRSFEINGEYIKLFLLCENNIIKYCKFNSTGSPHTILAAEYFCKYYSNSQLNLIFKYAENISNIVRYNIEENANSVVLLSDAVTNLLSKFLG